MQLSDKFPLSIQNSLSRKKEKFEPLNPPHVGMYVCGPTVYSEVHIGNVRTFITFDVLYRYLKALGYSVRYVRNITDVGHILDDSGEDRIAKRAKLEKLEPMEVVQKYTNYFHDIMKLFNTESPSIEPTATGHIIEQIQFVQNILDQGLAYEVNGSVYFDVEKYDKEHQYGKLSGRKIDELISNTRELDGQKEKRNPLDFAIWKKAEKQHIMRWPSPWSDGFPGWHLECSVMSTKYLGSQFDIHGGGMDLKFPHHECEVAQAVAAVGKDPVKYWIHGNMLTLDGAKMSKSLGNVISVEELIQGTGKYDKAFSAMTLRFFMLQAHYSSTLDISQEALEASDKGLKRLVGARTILSKLQYSTGHLDDSLDNEINGLIDECYRFLSDDLNTAKCIASLFDLAAKVNSFSNNQLSLGSIKEKTFKRLQKEFELILGDILGLAQENESEEEKLDEVMDILIEIRKDAREHKNFALSDAIRDELGKRGIKLLDGKEGTGYKIES